MATIPQLVDRYWVWLRERTTLARQGEWTEITTPFLDRHNDQLQVYARDEGDKIVLSDDGYIIQDLKLSGCELNSKKRRDLLETTLHGFGIKLENDALVTTASRETFPIRKHRLIQAMLAVNDMFYVASASVESLFLEDVASWLEANDVRYTPRAKFTGRSGFDHMFDFVIPGSRQIPERIVQAINRPTKSSAQNFILSWVDTVDVRPGKSRAYALLNDIEGRPPQSVIEALRNYDLAAIPWNERDRVLQELQK